MIKGVRVCGSFCFEGFLSLFHAMCLQYWDNHQFLDMFENMLYLSCVTGIPCALTMLFKTYKTIVHLYLSMVHKGTLKHQLLTKKSPGLAMKPQVKR